MTETDKIILLAVNSFNLSTSACYVYNGSEINWLLVVIAVISLIGVLVILPIKTNRL